MNTLSLQTGRPVNWNSLRHTWDQPDRWRNQLEYMRRASAAGRRAMLPTALFSGREKHVFEHAERVWPIYFHFPYKATDDVNIQLPAGWLVESVPKDEDRDLKGAEYSLKVEKNNGMVHIQRVLRCDLYMVPKESYPVLRGFFQFVKSEDEQQVVMQPGGTAASN